MSIPFEFASASVIGTNHRHPLKHTNGQDAYLIQYSEQATIALVGDGCSGGADSEVGTKLGIRIATQALNDSLLENPSVVDEQDCQSILQETQERVLFTLEAIVDLCNGDSTQLLLDAFLFTIVGAVLTPNISFFFHIGDGLIVVNGEENWIEAAEKNQPDYLAYELLRHKRFAHEVPVHFTLDRMIPTQQLNQFLIGTDGMQYLIHHAPLRTIWETDRFFQNRDALRRFLALQNQGRMEIDWDERTWRRIPGPLRDDTTLIAGRRTHA